jgi:predicted tellurium resistance membrane protein TerC
MALLKIVLKINLKADLMEDYTLKMILLFIAFIIGIVMIAWGFYAVDKTTMPKSEKIVWKVLFFVTPFISFVLFLLLRRNKSNSHN